MRLLAATTALLLSPLVADAKQLYVNAATGSDSTSYANNSAATPWATLGRAVWGSTNRSAPNTAEAARAGDTVFVAAGTYRAPGTGARFSPAFNPVNSGTASSPIVFQGNPSEPNAHGPSASSVVLQTTGATGPVIGAENRSYIVWDGFYIDEATAAPQADTGPVTINNSHHVTVRNSELKGIFAPWYSNHNGVRIEGATFSLIQNNRIHGFGDIRDGVQERQQNNTAVMLYDASDNVIEHNEFYDCGTGVFIKGQQVGREQARNVIRYNVIHSMGLNAPGRGIELGGSRDAQVYQNIITGGARPDMAGISIFGFDQPYDPPVVPLNDVIQNNVIVGVRDGIAFRGANPGQNVRFYNNVISGVQYAINGGRGGITSPGSADFEHNVYHAASVAVAQFASNLTLAGWKNTYGQDTVSPSAVDADPLFVNRTGGDYRLQAASPVRMLGRDLLNLAGAGTGATIAAGAYITGNEIIGLLGGSTPPPPPTPAPAAPSNLRIIR